LTRLVRLAALAFGAALQVACSGATGPDGPTEWGSHRATITGAVTGESSGPGAVFSRGPAWYLLLANAPQSTSEWSLDFAWSAPRPEAGATIAIGPGREELTPPTTHVVAGVYYLRRRDDQFFSWMAESGEIRILTSSSQRMSGTFELTASQHDGSALGAITVTGTFEAVCQAGFRQPPC
jgi:hypothetical protein